MITSILLASALSITVFGPGLVCALKGSGRALFMGIVAGGPLFWIPGAVRLAHPLSYWARWFYGPEKIRCASARHKGDEKPEHDALIAALLAVLMVMTGPVVGALLA
jgi:hypothetical protein